MFLSVILGRGGASIYGKEFEDECHQELKHVGKDCCEIVHPFSS